MIPTEAQKARAWKLLQTIAYSWPYRRTPAEQTRLERDAETIAQAIAREAALERERCAKIAGKYADGEAISSAKALRIGIYTVAWCWQAGGEAARAIETAIRALPEDSHE